MQGNFNLYIHCTCACSIHVHTCVHVHYVLILPPILAMQGYTEDTVTSSPSLPLASKKRSARTSLSLHSPPLSPGGGTEPSPSQLCNNRGLRGRLLPIYVAHVHIYTYLSSLATVSNYLYGSVLQIELDPSPVPRLSLLPHNNWTFDLLQAGQRSNYRAEGGTAWGRG